MSQIREDAEIRFKADLTRFREQMLSVRKDLSLRELTRAVYVAMHNDYEPVRIVVGRRLARILGIIEGLEVKLMGMVPVVVDEDAEDGFGLVARLVTRPPMA